MFFVNFFVAAVLMGTTLMYGTLGEILTEKGVKLPLDGQATTTTENRREAGTQTQVDIFGDGMRDLLDPKLRKQF